MKKYSHFIYGLSIIGLLVALVISYHNNNVLESRINTINKHLYKDLPLKPLSAEKNFKEDYYIIQQSKDTQLILTVFAILAGLVSLFTFHSIEKRFLKFELDMEEKSNEYQNKVSKKQKVHTKKLKRVEKQLWGTKIKLDFELIFIKKGNASKALSKGNYEEYLILSFECFVHYADCIMYDDKVNKEKLLTEMNDILTNLNNYLKHNPITIEGEYQKTIIEHINYINRIENSETYDLLNSIYSNLIFQIT